MKTRDPITADEWQEAVDTANLMLLVHSAILYGLITGPDVNADRCEEILRRGRERGVMPSPRLLEALNRD